MGPHHTLLGHKAPRLPTYIWTLAVCSTSYSASAIRKSHTRKGNKLFWANTHRRNAAARFICWKNFQALVVSPLTVTSPAVIDAVLATSKMSTTVTALREKGQVLPPLLLMSEVQLTCLDHHWQIYARAALAILHLVWASPAVQTVRACFLIASNLVLALASAALAATRHIVWHDS